jgi:hypothetical protein
VFSICFALRLLLPPKSVLEAGWKEGTELEATVKDGKITLYPKKEGC